jgi:hypothetical protein
MLEFHESALFLYSRPGGTFDNSPNASALGWDSAELVSPEGTAEGPLVVRSSLRDLLT